MQCERERGRSPCHSPTDGKVIISISSLPMRCLSAHVAGASDLLVGFPEAGRAALNPDGSRRNSASSEIFAES